MTRDFNPLIPAPIGQRPKQNRDYQDPVQEGPEQSPMPADPADNSRLDLASHVSAPLVDQALEATRTQHDETGFAENELAALKDELLSLEARVEAFGVTMSDAAIKRAEDYSDRTRATIRRQPLQCIALGLTVGFILGHRR